MPALRDRAVDWRRTACFQRAIRTGRYRFSSSESRANDRVNVKVEHHYNSPAERANDDLLITEVKSALAHDGVGDGYLIAVDCDHGKILLSGVVKSARDAKHAGDIAAAAEGVTGVNDQLTWH